ncbi:hypothetical protein COU78_05655 [Candidatus Peregrinibacteria bacterium CG10_big_fil_rev_8_21_14_0_10_49_24]|nr:MAG: hypothetical protein COV83_03440 [Candidatus Peregrinibacteria bacterium CG11_big_fil_rev_8_21_14_0_20_49_14]PIR50612.1 MAG: hypothetical protein COU78_05655 [Candidatus Peregrinibacteria bacterium CG10_big_fil_rev_8_21_14_0_10_49_24]PJA67070.1 MAG: hypothetical protein CO157_06450 [Candidatus Peregrinibacteria bacterium CG_4_9_14_3_um_filter_49_12]
MPLFFKRIGQFIFAVSSEYITIFGVIVSFVYYISALYIEQLQGTEELTVAILAVVIFPIACYSAWLKERNKLEDMQELMRSPVDYELTATIEKINFDLIRESYEITDEDIARANELINFWRQSEGILSTEEYQKRLTEGSLPTPQQCQEFLNSVDAYMRELNDFSQKIKNCYTVNFFIKNVGREVDEEIDVHVESAENVRQEYDCYKNVEDLCKLPRKPSYVHDIMLGRADVLHERLLWGIKQGSPPERWMRQSVIGRHINSEIDKLKAGTGCSLMWEETVFKTEAEILELEYWVASNKTTGVHQKKLTLDLTTAREWGTPLETASDV